MSEKQEPKVLIAIPMMHYVDAQFFRSILGLRKVGVMEIGIEVDSLVYEARNRLTITALDKEYDYMLFLDSDMVFQRDLLERLMADMKGGKEFVCGLAFKRRLPTTPVILKSIEWMPGNKEHGIQHHVEYFEDYPRDSLFEIGGCGFGCVLIKTSAILELAQYFGMSPFTPMPYLGEDYSFCWRMKQIGKKMWCDSSVKLGHVGQHIYTEEDYLKQQAEKKESGSRIQVSEHSSGISAEIPGSENFEDWESSANGDRTLSRDPQEGTVPVRTGGGREG